MLDVAAVGANMTPEQQDETLNDLAFFLDEFGSTRAVRVKLQDQERDIKRLKAQVQRRVNDRARNFHKNEEVEKDVESATKGSENATEDADETMAHLDFFLRTYGSTRAVREHLASQKREILRLQRTIKQLQDRRSTANGSAGSRAVEYVGACPAPAMTLVQPEDNRRDGVEDNESAGSALNTSSKAPTVRGKIKKQLCSSQGCEKWAQVYGLCAAHGGYRLCKVDGCNLRAAARRACRQHGGGTRCGTSGCKLIVASGGRGHCYKHAHARGIKMRITCNTDGCGMMADSHGRGHCYKHAVARGFEVKAECSTDGCEKRVVSGGHGHCFKHAVAQGFEMKAKCKVDGCSNLHVDQHYCQRHLNAVRRRPNN